jgi:hypothetical protein
MSRNTKTLALAVLLAVAALVAVPACSTVTPSAAPAGQASFDTGGQNSGVIDVAPGGRIVTRHFRDRYNEAVKVYGRDFSPAIAPDEGFTERPDGSFFVDLRHYSYALQMFRWSAAALKPMHP